MIQIAVAFNVHTSCFWISLGSFKTPIQILTGVTVTTDLLGPHFSFLQSSKSRTMSQSSEVWVELIADDMV